MVYPGVIMTVAVGAVAILLIFVIPTFQEMFAASGVPLPAPTQFVIYLSELLQARWWAILLAIAMIAVLIQRYYKTSNGQLVIDRLMLNVPVFGPLQRKDRKSTRLTPVT